MDCAGAAVKVAVSITMSKGQMCINDYLTASTLAEAEGTRSSIGAATWIDVLHSRWRRQTNLFSFRHGGTRYRNVSPPYFLVVVISLPSAALMCWSNNKCDNTFCQLQPVNVPRLLGVFSFLGTSWVSVVFYVAPLVSGHCSAHPEPLSFPRRTKLASFFVPTHCFFGSLG